MNSTFFVNHTNDENALVKALLIVGPLSLIVLIGFYWSGVTDLFNVWEREEYSHGYLVPPIALFLILRGLGTTNASQDQAAWSGIAICLFAAVFGVIGTLGRIPDIAQYGLIVALTGFIVALVGVKSALKLWAPILYLAFMIPLPQFLYLKLSAVMQGISSELGVGFIRMVGIPVFLDGNIIDLGIYKLQVAEACSGLRYLFPLMSFGFLFAVLFRGPWWPRVIRH